MVFLLEFTVSVGGIRYAAYERLYAYLQNYKNYVFLHALYICLKHNKLKLVYSLKIQTFFLHTAKLYYVDLFYKLKAEYCDMKVYWDKIIIKK